MGKGSNTTQTNQTQSYTPAGLGYMQNALNMAGNAAQLPFNIPQAPVAGFGQLQNQAFQGYGNLGNISSPFTQQAANYFSPAGAQQFFNPMSNAVMAQMQNIFGQQNAQNTGQLTQAAGGVGADRIAVGQAELANQQGLAAGQTLAGLYGQAQNTAQQAGSNMANLGFGAQNAQQSALGSMLGAGGLQQQLAQQQLNSPYQQQLAQAAFPYQQANFLAGITGAIAPGMGGTTTGTGTTTSQYNPSLLSQIGSAGLMGAGILSGFGRGGLVNPFASGGGVDDEEIDPRNWMSVDSGLIPTAQLPHAAAQMPQLNLSAPQQQGQGAGQNGFGGFGQLLQLGKAGSQLGGFFNPASWGGGSPFGGDAFGGSAANPLPGLSASDYGFAPGGRIDPRKFDGFNPFAFARGGYDDGGGLSFEDRAAPVEQAIASGDFDPQGINETTFQGRPIRVPLPAPRPDGAPADASDDETPSVRALSFSPAAVPPSPPAVGAPAASSPAAGADGGQSSFLDALHGFGQGVQKFERGPGMPLILAGLSALTPQGAGAGFATGMKLQQGQESVDQGAQRLAQEAQQHQDAMTKLTANQQAQVDLKKAELDKGEEGVISDEDAKYYGAIYNQTGQMPSLGYGKTAASNRAKIAQAARADATAHNLTPADIVANRIDYAASRAGATTAARAGANIDRAVIEAKNTFPLAEQASAAVPRGTWVPLNKVQQMFKSGTSDPALGQFMVANQGAITAYAAAMGRGNPVTTVHAQQHAEELLNTAGSHESYVARLRQMDKEMDAAQAAPGQVRQNIRGQITGQGAPAAPPVAPITKTINGKTYFQQNGQWFEQ